MTYSSTILADTPIDYWRFNETSGTSAADSGSGAHAATHNANVTVGAGGRDAAGASYNGTSASTSAASVADFMTGSFSVELWVKYSTVTGDYSNFIRRDGNSTAWLIRTRNTTVGRAYIIECYHSGMTLDTGTVTFNDNNWHHVVYTWNGTTPTLYVDGTAYTTSKTGTVAAGGTGLTPLYIGTANGTSDYFKGNLDEVAIYNTALSSAKVSAHYAAAPVPNVTTLPPVVNVGTLTTVAPALAGPIVNKTVTPPVMTLSLDMATAPVVSTTNILNATADRNGTVTDWGATDQDMNFGTTASGTVLVQFATPSIPSGMRVAQAQLYLHNSQPITSTIPASVRRATASWTEVTTNNPTTTASNSASATLSSNSGNLIDVTNIVRDWAAGATNYGFSVIATGASSTGANWLLDARENATSSFRPQLVYSLEVIPPTPVTVTPPVMALDLTAIAPVVSGVSNITDDVPAISLGTLDAVTPAVTASGNKTVSVPAMDAGSLAFVGGVLENYLALPDVMTLDLTTPNASQRIEYPSVTTVPVMEFSLENFPATINLTTDRRTVAPVMTLTLRFPGIYVESADRYLTLLNSIGLLPEDTWYKLNESSGTSAADSTVASPFNTPGDFVGPAPEFHVDGPQLRKAVGFNGTNYLRVNHQIPSGFSTNANFPWGALTVEFSIRTTQQNGVVYTAFDGFNNAGTLNLENGLLVFRTPDGGVTKVRDGYLADGQWHHVVISMPKSSDDPTYNGSTLSYVMIDGKVAIGRYYGFASGHIGQYWYPRSFLANENYTWNYVPAVGGEVGTPGTPSGFLAADLSNIVLRGGTYTPEAQAQNSYYEWSDSVLVKHPDPMTVNLSVTPPFKARGNTKRMLALYGLGWGQEQHGRPIDVYYSNLFDFMIENVGVIDPFGDMTTSPFPSDTSVLATPIYPKPKSFQLGDYHVYPVSIIGRNGAGSPQSMDGLISPDAMKDEYTGDYIDDKTGIPRWVNLQTDLAEDVTEFDAITVVNYPWFKPNAFPPQGGSFGSFDSYPPDGMLQQNGQGLSDIQWSEARDALRDSILQAAYGGVNLWIGEWHAAQHLGFIQDVDFHYHGWWYAGGTDPVTGLMSTGYGFDGPLGQRGAPNVEAQILDRIHLDPDNAHLGIDYYNTGTKAHPTASDTGKPAKYIGYLPNGGVSYYNWIYDTGGGYYQAEPQMNHYRRVVAEVPGITDLPTNEIANMVQGRAWDGFKPNGDFTARDYLRRPNGLQVGDYSYLNILTVEDNAVRSLRNLRTQIISARPDGIAGQVVTREMTSYWGPDGVVVDNPFKDNAFTIAAEVGTVVRGKPIKGRAFIELMDNGYGMGAWPEDVDKTMWLGTSGKNVSTWQFDERRVKETVGILGNSSTSPGQYSYLPYPTWHYRGVNWLGQARQLQPGDVVSYPSPITLDISTPAPQFSRTANPVTQVNGAMTLFLEVRQPANYRDGNVQEFALAMNLSLEMRGVGVGINTTPITLTISTPSPTLDVARETIPVYLDNNRTVTLFLKEEI